MTGELSSRAGLSLEQYLAQAELTILPRALSKSTAPLKIPANHKLRVGVDLGTAYLTLVVLDEEDALLAGEWQFAQVARDGLVVDFIRAIDLLLGMKARVEKRLGRPLTHAASGYPPGVPRAEVQATANVIESAGMECTRLIDEPSAANRVLQLREGAVVDVGGGTTGIAIFKDGEVVYTADEPTGGTHFSLVIAGALNISFEEAERMKIDPAEQARLFPVVRPVMEKVAAITLRHIKNHPVETITMVGGASAFPGMAEVLQSYTGIPTYVPSTPVFVTPLGLAMADEAA
ncbi:MAG: ethanolamine utilization protein EutJ [Anaerolineaceae bacterium]|nr:ethanolamine utilization protein EutJ [Anaerolineaceae bacterium]